MMLLYNSVQQKDVSKFARNRKSVAAARPSVKSRPLQQVETSPQFPHTHLIDLTFGTPQTLIENSK